MLQLRISTLGQKVTIGNWILNLYCQQNNKMKKSQFKNTFLIAHNTNFTDVYA